MYINKVYNDIRSYLWWIPSENALLNSIQQVAQILNFIKIKNLLNWTLASLTWAPLLILIGRVKAIYAPNVMLVSILSRSSLNSVISPMTIKTNWCLISFNTTNLYKDRKVHLVLVCFCFIRLSYFKAFMICSTWNLLTQWPPSFVFFKKCPSRLFWDNFTVDCST